MEKRDSGTMQGRLFKRMAQGVVCRIGKVCWNQDMREGHDGSSPGAAHDDEIRF
jgi:hypothetical protein